MVFSSILFMFIYLPAVLLVYYLSPVKYRNILLFFANLIFYGWGEPVYILLMMFSITVNYLSGLLVNKHRSDDRRARRYVTLNTIINLALLIFFKYFDFFVSVASSVPGLGFMQPLGIALPIGISFYTFQSISYPIDIYRGDAAVQKKYINFGTFVALFPQLIAGPIVRYKDISSQLGYRALSAAQFASGVRRFVIGLGKKVLIANSIGVLWDTVSALPSSELTAFSAWLGILAFTFQIYFDFSGYSDMAIGLGRMIGFEFLENFNYPYISKSITEFWRRWHISLSTWFRDYVYIPLGGNRQGLKRQLFNIFIVWALTGFWHGANWTFLLWGIYYAIFLMLEKIFLLNLLEKAPHVVTRVYTLLIVVCGWVLFQLDSVGQCALYLRAMFGFGEGGLSTATDFYYFASYLPTFIISIVASTPAGKKAFGLLPAKLQSVLAPVLVLLVLIVSTAYLVDATYNPFLYFRF